MPETPLRETPCEFCETMVKSVLDFLNDTDTRTRVEAFLDQVRGALPPPPPIVALTSALLRGLLACAGTIRCPDGPHLAP